jgi:ankyrin repeat protein
MSYYTNGNSKLSNAVIRRESADNILHLMKQFPNNIQQRNYDNEYPLHLACKYNHPDMVVLKLLTSFPQGASERDKYGDYPLHNACRRKQSEKVVLQLLNSFPQAATEKDNIGDYPLHSACRTNQSEKIIIQLLYNFPQAASKKDAYGCYPLHLACRYTQSENVMFALIDTYPLAIKTVIKERYKPLKTILNYARDVGRSETMIEVLETLMEKSDHELKNKGVNVIMIVMVNGLANRQHQEIFQWLLLNP